MYVIYYKKAKYLTMDTKKIKALLASVDRGSLTAAAKAHHLGYESLKLSLRYDVLIFATFTGNNYMSAWASRYDTTGLKARYIK